MQVDFYQLGRDPLARVLASIAARVLAGKGRLLVVTGDPAQAAAIDAALWEGEDSFLPHGRWSEEDRGEDQPVLIAPACDPANGARHIALVDGEWRDSALGFDRAFHFFDDRSIAAAREAWRALSDRKGVEPRFWRQSDEGRWEKVA